MYTEERQAADFVLTTDENVLWAERRSPRWNRDKIAIALVLVLIGVIYAAAALYGETTLSALLPLPCRALLLRYMRLRDIHTIYILTDRRAIIVQEALWGARASAVTKTP